MSVEMRDAKKPKVIRADYSLQSKIGEGPLDERVIERCQKVMDSNNVDFSPLAREFLTVLDEAIKQAKTNNLSTQQTIEAITQPVMQLKANAAIFRYELIGNLANVMLSFLEAVTVLDADVLAIVDAHHKTLSAIVLKKMAGNGGVPGRQLEDELKNACKRYFARKPK